jgi:hypothetical protein
MRLRSYCGLILATLPLVSQAPAAGQAARSSTIPRARSGSPDLSGIWLTMSTAAWDIQDHSAQKGIPAGQGIVEGNDIPYQEWALAKRKDNYEHRATLDPEAHCYLPGVPRGTYMPFPFQIVQVKDMVTILYEYVHATRYIYLNGSQHPANQFDLWMGDSRGRWDGDTLVVDLDHFNDQTWFDRAGNFHSDALHEIERYTLTDADHINYTVTIEDPKVFTSPWNMSTVLYRRKEKNVQLLDYECYGFDFEKYYPYPDLTKGASK